MGAGVGEAVGASVGAADDATVGEAVGKEVGAPVGAAVGKALVGLDKDVVRDMAGIKSQHCFVTCGGYVLMFPTSCTCQPCRNMEYDECELVTSGERGGGKRIDLQTFVPAIQEERTTFGSTFERGWAVMAKCKVDDWVLMRADVDLRKAYSKTSPRTGHVVVVSGWLKSRSCQSSALRERGCRQRRGGARGISLSIMRKSTSKRNSGSSSQL
ncbi:hypothetical protein VYU27_004735 [Nannochloropsis oceanica]